MDLEATLRAAAAEAPGAGDWRPTLFDLDAEPDRAALATLLEAGGVGSVHDTIRDQLADLAAALEPTRDGRRPDPTARVREILAGVPPERYGRWVYYPWTRRLVHVLPPAEFRRLRADRNRYKITPADEQRLRAARVGIVGLSVGMSVALTLALEGVGGSFRLADFDTLGLSNLNRLRAGVADLGLNKAVLAARQMVELDPYLDLHVFPQGVTDAALDEFFEAGGGLDLLVEECDDLYAKVRLREEARRRGIPVVMDTSDRGLIDVERFDREPDRPLFHGLAGAVRAAELKGLPTRDKVPFVLGILDAPRLSAAMRASMVEIGESVETWPQLGSAVTLGGALTCDVVRRILLGSFTESGRFYVDLEELVRDGAAVPLPMPEAAAPPAAESLSPSDLPRRPVGGTVSPEAVRYLAAHGVLAPSGGNAQPWRFEWAGGRLRAYLDPARSDPALDFEHAASHLAFGAAAENMRLAAASIGLRADIEPFPDSADPLLVFRLALRPGDAAADPDLFAQVRLRVTNRRRGPRVPPTVGEIAGLRAAAADRGADLRLITDPSVLESVGAVLGRGDRMRFLDEALHRGMMGEMRWTPAEAVATRDGIDVATLELPAADRAALQVVAAWPPMAYLGQVGAGGALERPARDAMAAAGGVGMLTAPGAGPGSYFQGGRAVQRVWLRAAALGLALQPWSVLPYLFARLERGGGRGLSRPVCEALRGLRTDYRRHFPIGPDEAELLLFRVGRAGPPSARSLRRPLDEVLRIA